MGFPPPAQPTALVLSNIGTEPQAEKGACGVVPKSRGMGATPKENREFLH